eukprot:546263-Rhodomonas_salina.17
MIPSLSRLYHRDYTSLRMPNHSCDPLGHWQPRARAPPGHTDFKLVLNISWDPVTVAGTVLLGLSDWPTLGQRKASLSGP